ncbi:MAG: sensor domain-containing diguanylate cyclase [Rubrivivax sp.]|nr:MAG: sensor domain-containing diguanylate cyclase [Rubrivivax sp.]
MRSPALTWLVNAAFSTDAKQRLRITRSLMAATVYLLCIGLEVYACYAGYMQLDDAKLLGAACMANVVWWYLVLRSGVNLRFKDPSLTLPQILSSLTIIIGAYSLTGPVHGSTLMLLALVLVFGIFNLKAKGAMIAGAYTVVVIAVAMAIKVTTDPVHYPFKLEFAHFWMTVAIVPTISSLAVQLSNMREKLKAQKNELAEALTRIQILATRDELTGLFNRRHMLDVLGQHQKRLERSGYHRFCLAILDIDHFKKVNDTYGHGVGDEVLRHFAEAAQAVMRDTDVLARWGGEEFLLLLNDTSPALANIGLERIRNHMATVTLAPSHPDLKPTFSAGLTGYCDNERLDVCIERADRALYRAKHEGRNRTVIQASPEDEAITAGQAPVEARAPDTVG